MSSQMGSAKYTVPRDSIFNFWSVKYRRLKSRQRTLPWMEQPDCVERHPVDFDLMMERFCHSIARHRCFCRLRVSSLPGFILLFSGSQLSHCFFFEFLLSFSSHLCSPFRLSRLTLLSCLLIVVRYFLLDALSTYPFFVCGPLVHLQRQRARDFVSGFHIAFHPILTEISDL